MGTTITCAGALSTTPTWFPTRSVYPPAAAAVTPRIRSVELVAPRYVADRHGPATGLNLLQAYLALRDPDSAQHVLDLLFSLNRPELEDRLHGFSNAIAEMLASPLPLAGAVEGETRPYTSRW